MRESIIDYKHRPSSTSESEIHGIAGILRERFGFSGAKILHIQMMARANEYHKIHMVCYLGADPPPIPPENEMYVRKAASVWLILRLQWAIQQHPNAYDLEVICERNGIFNTLTKGIGCQLVNMPHE